MRILSPAKINLFLKITGKRPDGYHDLVSLMCCVGLYDTVSLTFDVTEASVSCSHPDVPEDETNLAFTAASLFFNTLNINKSVKISIEKQIPVAAGLGGGSSNAAAVFLGLNRHYGYPFSLDKLISMGLSIGADVPFFIFRKPAIVSGIGDKLKAYQKLESFKILLVFPGFSISTAKVYKNLNLGLTNCKKKLRSFLLNEQSFDPRCHLCNDLETTAASMYPGIFTVKEALLRHGALGALMSGSGSTVFGLFSDSDKALKAKNVLAENDKWQLYLVDMITKETRDNSKQGYL
ncbi:MAG: 4-(cytidine 5'-diphospho)-2-C-methyl-D-erythritol kinase [Deltaproteobacteria bacterium]|nr:4-(cytidine 5'-diphospho)-2-C-methyl-D-erythritol kinase [Deltaproteobacteria bacterium]MBW2012881.1 4-(cytidine 5'-diphospho)-2-C-methyl-D-erythritol kinase [Deltaproteobacteria bacterium]MBW2088337.1 4-(cytidine 5'-diphospho)-2-C-methyl-D-erythritol kinase [Deltaproteobacteria bacterium]